MDQNSLSNHISVVDNPILGPTQKKFGPSYEAHSSLQKPHKIENNMRKNTCIPQIVPNIWSHPYIHRVFDWRFVFGYPKKTERDEMKHGDAVMASQIPSFHGDSGACFDGLVRRFPGFRCSLAVQTPVRWEPCGCAGGCDVQPVHVNHIYSTCATYLHDQTCILY